MYKKVLLLAVSCKNGGLCPGGIDMDNPSQWIRIVANDGCSGAVQGYEIDFAQPLDIIGFDGTSMPQGVQKENWIINNCSCKKIGNRTIADLDEVYSRYGYHGFWGNYKSYLTEEELEKITAPSESIMKVSNVKIYQNDYGKAKIDFEWDRSIYPIKWISMTDQDFYARINNGEVIFMDKAYIVVSIPKDIYSYIDPFSAEKKAFKFVSKVFEIK